MVAPAEHGRFARMKDVNLDDAVMAADCALRSDFFLITHIDTVAERFSGWTISCTEDHDHGERTFVPVRTLVERFPQVARYLTLPVGASVLFGAGEPHVLYGQEPRRYPRHRWLGSFRVTRDIIVSDGREPDTDTSFLARGGQWHAYLRVARDGTPHALMVIHGEFLDRANDDPLSYGGDHAQGIATLTRISTRTVTADWKALKDRLEPSSWELVRLVAKNEPEFVARWGIGPVRVGIGSKVVVGAQDGDAEVGVSADGCWATTVNDDGWAVYAVHEGDHAVMLRVRLTSETEHAYLVDKTVGGTRLRPPITDPARPYTREATFAVGDVVDNPAFGVGRVTAVNGKRLTVAFDFGDKQLVQA